MLIAKQTILDLLRDRGQAIRADWVDRALPDVVDTDRHAGILATLRLDPAELTAPQ